MGNLSAYRESQIQRLHTQLDKQKIINSYLRKQNQKVQKGEINQNCVNQNHRQTTLRSNNMQMNYQNPDTAQNNRQNMEHINQNKSQLRKVAKKQNIQLKQEKSLKFFSQLMNWCCTQPQLQQGQISLQIFYDFIIVWENQNYQKKTLVIKNFSAQRKFRELLQSSHELKRSFERVLPEQIGLIFNNVSIQNNFDIPLLYSEVKQCKLKDKADDLGLIKRHKQSQNYVNRITLIRATF